jgi:glucose/arabinose dehydrogenase
MTCVVAADARAQGPATHRITPDQVPAPTTSSPNPPKVVPLPQGARLTAPDGFRVEIFADGLKRPRWAVEAPNGDVFVSDPSLNAVLVLRDRNGNHAIEPDERSEFASGLTQPFGMAFANGALYVADTDAVLRFAYEPGQLKASGAPVTVAELPHGPKGHWTRNISFSKDGTSFWVTVGSSSDHDPDPDPLRATVLRFKADGSGREAIATGVRNAIGFDLNPSGGAPWMAVQERDGIGDDAVPDFVTELKTGAFYGWPWSYIGQHLEPRLTESRPELVKTAVVPDVLIQSHSAVMGLVFYSGASFPARYRGGAFAALRGSSGRSKRTGYKVIYLPFEGAKATGAYEDFVTGWMLGEDTPDVWGRPVGLAVLRDGSMLVTDDGAGRIWRISYGR